jgi:simple sugar transport system substrate-binding protein
MKVPKLGLIGAAAALVLAGCASGQSSDSDGDNGGSANADIKICMYTHGDGGGFWSVAKKGAEKAADDLGVTLDYQESNNDPEAQAQFIEAGVSGGCDGIAVSAPNPDAIADALSQATDAGIPIVTMNSGSDVFQDLGAYTHVGQDEFIAGQEAGKKFQELGATKILCPIQEANNIGLQQRCDGAKDTFGNVENLQLSSGLADLSKSEAEIQAKLEADPSIDAVFALNADIATGSAMPAAEAVGRDIQIGTVDLSGDAVQAIKDGDMAFAIDQQQYAQGYLPVVLLYLNKIDGLVLGGGQPIYTGPGFVTQENADQVQQLAEEGTR